jgi:hypothetical protein
MAFQMNLSKKTSCAFNTFIQFPAKNRNFAEIGQKSKISPKSTSDHPEARNDCAGEAQQQFNRPTDLVSQSPP